jgi:superfamily II DNA or RNA helicase
MEDLSNAKIDLFDIDDFVDSIEKETKAINDIFHKRLEKAKSLKHSVDKYLKDIGVLIGSEKNISNKMIIGFVDYSKNKLLKKVKPNLVTMEYSFNDTKSETILKIDSNTVFNRHVLITDNKQTWKTLTDNYLVHQGTAVILCDSNSDIVDSKVYTRVKNNNSNVYLKDRRNLILSFDDPNFKSHQIELMHKNLYRHFSIFAGISEFSNKFEESKLNGTNMKSTFNNSGDESFPFNDVEHAAVSVSSDTINFDKDNGVEKLQAITNMFTSNDRIKYTDSAKTILDNKKHCFNIETDVLVDNESIELLFDTLVSFNLKTSMTSETLSHLLRTARRNNYHYMVSRNDHMDNLDDIKKGHFTKLAKINAEYNLTLEYHQIYAVVNCITQKSNILKADVGLGKTRSAISLILTRGGKYNLLVTEPGNVLELEREFKEQLKMGDITNIIKTEKDLKNLKVFNIIGYSTLAKVIKESKDNLLEVPTFTAKLIDSTGKMAEYDHLSSISTKISDNDFDIYFNYSMLRDMFKEKDGKKALKLSACFAKVLEECGDLDNESIYDFHDILLKNLDKDTAITIKDILLKNLFGHKIDKIMASLDEARYMYSHWDWHSSEKSSESSTSMNTLRSSIKRVATDSGRTDIVSYAIDAKLFKILIIIMSNPDLNLKDLVVEMGFSKQYNKFKKYFDIIINNIEKYNKKYKDDFDESQFCNNFMEPDTTGYRNNTTKSYTPKVHLMELIFNIMEETADFNMTKLFIDDFNDCKDDMKAWNKIAAGSEVFSGGNRRANIKRFIDVFSSSEHFSKMLFIEFQKALYTMGKALYKKASSINNTKNKAKYKNKMFASLLSGKFNTVVYDECHSIKNISSVRSLAVSQLKAKNYLFMSATPIANDVSEILSYLTIGHGPRSLKHMVDIEHRTYRNYRGNYNKEYQIDITKDKIIYDLNIVNSISDYRNRYFPAKRLDNIMDRNITRVLRTDENVVKGKSFKFDVKEYKVHSVPTENHMQLYAAQMEIVYDAYRNGKYEDSREALTTLLNLIKISEIPHLISPEFEGFLTAKQNDIVKLAKKHLDKGRSVIIFSQFTEMISILANELSQKVSNNIYSLADNISPDKRFKLIDAFRKDENNAAILGTVGKLGKGFNLACADVVIMSDIPWSAYLYDQSIGRILRPDQDGKPEIFVVMNKYMIDMYKFDSVMAKLNMIKKYVDKNSSVKEEDTKKMDYKKFLLDLISAAQRDGLLEIPEVPQEQEVSISGGV